MQAGVMPLQGIGASLPAWANIVISWDAAAWTGHAACTKPALKNAPSVMTRTIRLENQAHILSIYIRKVQLSMGCGISSQARGTAEPMRESPQPDSRLAITGPVDNGDSGECYRIALGSRTAMR